MGTGGGAPQRGLGLGCSTPGWGEQRTRASWSGVRTGFGAHRMENGCNTGDEGRNNATPRVETGCTAGDERGGTRGLPGTTATRTGKPQSASPAKGRARGRNCKYHRREGRVRGRCTQGDTGRGTAEDTRADAYGAGAPQQVRDSSPGTGVRRCAGEG